MPAISSKASGLKLWLGDPSVYPIMAVVSFACVMCGGYSLFAITAHNDGEFVFVRLLSAVLLSCCFVQVSLLCYGVLSVCIYFAPFCVLFSCPSRNVKFRFARCAVCALKP
jgi:hypothetical protein